MATASFVNPGIPDLLHCPFYQRASCDISYGSLAEQQILLWPSTSLTTT